MGQSSQREQNRAVKWSTEKMDKGERRIASYASSAMPTFAVAMPSETAGLSLQQPARFLSCSSKLAV